MEQAGPGSLQMQIGLDKLCYSMQQLTRAAQLKQQRHSIPEQWPAAFLGCSDVSFETPKQHSIMLETLPNLKDAPSSSCLDA